jgi:DNA-binding CsgD family transcriptional regulator
VKREPAASDDAQVDGCHLGKRQIEVTALVAAGLTSREVGRVLGISEKTVDRHLAVAMALLGARSRAHLVALCYAGGGLCVGEWPPQPTGVLFRNSCPAGRGHQQ